MSKDRRLTLALPIDVWRRLHREAAEQGVSIGTLGRRLLVERDAEVNK